MLGMPVPGQCPGCTQVFKPSNTATLSNQRNATQPGCRMETRNYDQDSLGNGLAAIWFENLFENRKAGHCSSMLAAINNET